MIKNAWRECGTGGEKWRWHNRSRNILNGNANLDLCGVCRYPPRRKRRGREEGGRGFPRTSPSFADR